MAIAILLLPILIPSFAAKSNRVPHPAQKHAKLAISAESTARQMALHTWLASTIHTFLSKKVWVLSSAIGASSYTLPTSLVSLAQTSSQSLVSRLLQPELHPQSPCHRMEEAMQPLLRLYRHLMVAAIQVDHSMVLLLAQH